MATKRRTVKREKPSKTPFIGHWDIIDSEDIDDEALVAGPAEISFEAKDYNGRLYLCAIKAEIDWREGADSRTVEFTFEGHDEEEEVFGRGRGWLDDGGHLLITIWFHKGDTLNLIGERNG